MRCNQYVLAEYFFITKFYRNSIFPLPKCYKKKNFPRGEQLHAVIGNGILGDTPDIPAILSILHHTLIYSVGFNSPHVKPHHACSLSFSLALSGFHCQCRQSIASIAIESQHNSNTEYAKVWWSIESIAGISGVLPNIPSTAWSWLPLELMSGRKLELMSGQTLIPFQRELMSAKNGTNVCRQ